MKPLARYDHGIEWLREVTPDGQSYASCMVPDDEGQWYAKDEADARIAELEAELAQLRITAEVASRHLMRERDDAWAERDAARAELGRKRVIRNSDQTRARCKHFAICLAEIALNGSKEAEAAFRAVMPLVSKSHPSRREVKQAAIIASDGMFGISDDPYQDAVRGAE